MSLLILERLGGKGLGRTTQENSLRGEPYKNYWNLLWGLKQLRCNEATDAGNSSQKKLVQGNRKKECGHLCMPLDM